MGARTKPPIVDTIAPPAFWPEHPQNPATWPEDPLKTASDEPAIVDIAPVKKDESKPYYNHTCKSARKKGAAINIYLKFTTFAPFTDHDWRHCPGCLSDYAYRKTRQVENETKRGKLTATWFETTEDWKRTRKKWNTWKRREKEVISFSPFNQEDGRILVIHSSANETDIGQELPKGDELDTFVLNLCQTPAKTKNRASGGFGGEYQGWRGEGRTTEGKKKVAKRPDCYQLKTSASSARIAQRVYGETTDTRGRGRKELHCADSYLNLVDWQHDELLKKHTYTLAERHDHNGNNEVVRAIFDDERVPETLKYYRAYRKANGLSPLSDIQENPMVLKDDSLEVDMANEDTKTVNVTQKTFVFKSDGTDAQQHSLAKVPKRDEADLLDWYLELRRG